MLIFLINPAKNRILQRWWHYENRRASYVTVEVVNTSFTYSAWFDIRKTTVLSKPFPRSKSYENSKLSITLRRAVNRQCMPNKVISLERVFNLKVYDSTPQSERAGEMSEILITTLGQNGYFNRGWFYIVQW